MLALDCDFLIPAALGSAINEKNVDSLNCKVIVEAANGPVTGTWSQQYGSIAEVNNAISNAGLDANQMAQAKVVRAYLHWRLMDLYGNIVIADGSGSSNQSSRSAVFNWVEGELLSALGMGSSFDLSGLSSYF